MTVPSCNLTATRYTGTRSYISRQSCLESSRCSWYLLRCFPHDIIPPIAVSWFLFLRWVLIRWLKWNKIINSYDYSTGYSSETQNWSAAEGLSSDYVRPWLHYHCLLNHSCSRESSRFAFCKRGYKIFFIYPNRSFCRRYSMQFACYPGFAEISCATTPARKILRQHVFSITNQCKQQPRSRNQCHDVDATKLYDFTRTTISASIWSPTP